MGLLDLARDGQDRDDEDVKNTSSWLALARAQRVQRDSAIARASVDSVAIAHSIASFDRMKSQRDSARKAITVTPFKVIDSTWDTTRFVGVQRRGIDIFPHKVPAYVWEAVMTAEALLDTATMVMQAQRALDAQRLNVIALYATALHSRDSVIVTRDDRISVLKERHWYDYVGATCGVGVRGTDCVAGVTLRFFGRKGHSGG